MSPAGTTESCIAAPRTGSFFSRPRGTWFCFPSLPAVENGGLFSGVPSGQGAHGFLEFPKGITFRRDGSVQVSSAIGIVCVYLEAQSST
jgi:hypothetical protein